MRDNDVRYGKKRAHKKDLARRHMVHDLEWEATEYIPEDIRPLRLNL